MIVKKIKKIRVGKWQKLNRLYEKYIIGAFFVHLHSFSITNIFNTVTHKEIINANKGFYQGFGVVSIEIFKECQQHHSLNGGPFKAQVQANQAESARVQQISVLFFGSWLLSNYSVSYKRKFDHSLLCCARARASWSRNSPQHFPFLSNFNELSFHIVNFSQVSK